MQRCSLNVALLQKKRILNLLKLGDRSLFLVGFFPQCLERRMVSQDYYIACGQKAYESVSKQIKSHNHPNDIFGELAGNFRSFVRILNEASDRFNMSKDSLIRLYQRWFNEKNPRLEKFLQERGMLPLDASGQRIYH